MQKIVDNHKKIAILNSYFILSLSLLIVLIWQFDLITLKNLFPGNHISNPVTALCFTASIASFFLLVNKNPQLHLPGKIIAAAVFLTGLIRFSEVLLGFSTGIDRWLYTNKLFLYGNNGNPNFMAPNTAFAFVFLGASLLSYRFRIHQKNKLADFLALAVALFSFVSMTGYLYNSGEFYKVKSYIPMAFPTALSFLVCSTSILFYRSEFGFFSVFTAQYSGGKIARFLVPFAIAVPVITGLMNVYGEELKLYSPSFGVAFFATVNIIAFLFLICGAVYT
jgi:hypothetical protein